MRKIDENKLYDIDKEYEFLETNEIAPKEVLEAITSIYGYNEDVINDIIYYYTGYHDVEQLYFCCKNEFDFSMFE